MRIAQRTIRLLMILSLGIVPRAGGVAVSDYVIFYNSEPGPYLVDVWTVADNFINTGLAYNPIDHTLFCAHLDFALQGESIEELHRADGQRAAPPIPINLHTALPQGLTYDPGDSSLYVWGGDCGYPDKYVTHFARNGAHLSDDFAMPGYPGMLAFDTARGMIWSKECNASMVLLYALNGAVADEFDTGIGGEGIARDPRDDTFWVLTEQQLYHVERVGNGVNVLGSYSNPSHHYPPDIQLGYTVSGAAEGLIIDPTDGTLWFNADQHCHGSVPNGNRCWHVDPLQTHDRFVRFPGGVRWERGVGVRTEIDGEELKLASGAEWGEYVTAIIDFGSRIALADSLTSLSGGTVTRGYRGSDTAPTTTPLEHITRPYYDSHEENFGWGATPPGEWSPEIPAVQFLQVKMTLHASSAAVIPIPLSADCRVAPSPFCASTALSFVLTRSAHVAMQVLDIEGRCIRNLYSLRLARGEHALRWDGRDGRGCRAPAGSYMLRLITDQGVIQRRVIALGE